MINIPFGKFKNWDDCVSKLKAKGHDDESAKKMCGKMKADMEKYNALNWHTFEYAVPLTIVEGAVTESTLKDGPLTVQGIAIEATTSRNGVKYVAEELSKAHQGLAGKPILKDHRNEIDAIAGIVQNTAWDATKSAITFRGNIMDAKAKEMIRDGRIQHVSIGAKVKNLKQEEAADGEKVMVAEGIEFLELSLTPVPGIANASITQALSESFKFKKIVEEIDDPEWSSDEEKDDEDKDEDADEKAEVNNVEENVKLNELAEANKVLVAELEAFKTLERNRAVDELLRADTSWKKEDVTDFSTEQVKKLAEKAKLNRKVEEKTIVATETAQESDGIVTEYIGGQMAFWKPMPKRAY